jgi:hypothetical protein
MVWQEVLRVNPRVALQHMAHRCTSPSWKEIRAIRRRFNQVVLHQRRAHFTGESSANKIQGGGGVTGQAVQEHPSIKCFRSA